MNDITRTSKELVRTPWRAETFAVYDAAGELVVHTGVLGNRLSNAQRETIARVVVEAVNAYSSNEPAEEHEELIRRLRNFGQAYPYDVFPALTAEERTQVGGNLISRISAGMGRHCSKIMAEAADALERSASPPAADLDEAAHDLAMLAIQSDRYIKDIEYREAVDNVFEITKQTRRAALTKAVAPRTCSWERRGDHFNCHACGSMSKTTQGRDEIIADCQRRPTANRGA